MRVWLYYRLSRDEDEELNSLLNQRSIIESYALSHGHTIVGESCDDNISGMHFDRDGIEQLTEAVDAGLIDAVIVKDLSRLGRHRTQTALYIDYLRQNHVRVLSATENIDTFNEADDLVIGFKGLINDYYARDGSRRVTTGYRQKQKTGIVITPPLSRLGRHQMQTALFIDYLRQCGVAVISVTEGLDTMDDGDDLIIGVRQLMNDYYAKDIGNKIRHGYREKQKEGLVVKPPFGYWKDRNTGRIRLHPEASVTVQIIYTYYGMGLGQKEITRRLNAMQRKTPKQFHDERCGKAQGRTYRWTYQSVKNVLVEESYTGLLVNHRTETHGRTVTLVPEDEQYRHEDFFPVIIDREEWEQVQALLKANAKPYRGNTASHRYAGLLTCGDCGSTFVPRIRCWNGSRRVEYLCKSYMHHGKEFCPSHRIRESELDDRVQRYAEELRNQWTAEQADLRRLHRLWEMKRPAINSHIADLYDEIQRLEQEIDELLLAKIDRNKQGHYLQIAYSGVSAKK